VRFVRYERGGAIRFGRIEGDHIDELAGAPWDGSATTGGRVALRDVELLCPVTPSKIIACGVTYEDHAGEAGGLLPQHDFASAKGELIYGLRATTVLNGPGRPIVRPAVVERLDHEAELAVVIGRRAKRVTEEQALDHVFGFTCYNDCGARDIQMRSPLLSQKAKSIDTFGCCGPWIVTDGVDLANARIECRVNGETRQSATLGHMNRSIASIVAEISQLVTLLPGDVIATGSPAGVSPMAVGDTVEVEIQGIGILRNHVIAEVAS
jgi:2-keto-4-pentenoate hydratase/2-oxohepta-3-ene-1,7-dioic acid hydratase in catechol pathway